MADDKIEDKMSEQSIRAFFGELLALCEKFAVVHLNASPCDRTVVTQFGEWGQESKLVSYGRDGEPAICVCKRDMLGRVIGDKGWWTGNVCGCEADIGS